ncbi:MAG: helix-turn-helix transcriptional regulator [Candidatus Aminicenantes bacterium]|nr:helix-turn-helix transcriptional regulator [Candidatus Aminicenantes bacterium]
MVKDKQLEETGIGKRLKEVRKALKLTQSEITVPAGLSKSYLSELELGKSKSCSMLYQYLADEHNVNVNYILTGRGKMFIREENTIDTETFGHDSDIVKEIFLLMKESNSFKYQVFALFSQLKAESPKLKG